MKSLVSLTSLLLLIIFLSSSQHHVTSQQQDDLIAKLCKHTPYFQLCVSTLRSNHGSSKETFKGLSLIALDVAKAKTTATLSDIKKVMESNPLRLKGPLSKCSELYNTILNHHIPEAIEAVTKDDPKGAEDGVSKAAMETEECKKILISIKNPSQVVGTLGQYLPEIFSIVLSIIRSWLAGIGKGHGSL